MVAQLNANDPRVKRTRQLLQRALGELVQEKSFEAITVQDITERATLNRATFYAHFEDKYALLDATMGASLTETLLRRIPADARMSKETARHIILAVCDYHIGLSKQCARAEQTLTSALEPRVRTYLCDIVLACLLRTEAMRAMRRETIEMAATMVSWAIYGAVLQWYREGRSQPAETFAETILPMIVGSITAIGRPAGQEISSAGLASSAS